MTTPENIHATGLVLAGKGLLLRGPSGSGKSLLALTLLESWEARGLKAQLVSDDRVDLVASKGQLMMIAPPAIAGLIELRGRGIVQRPHADKARVDLVIDFVPDLVRMVEEEDLETELMGIALARCPVPKVEVTGLQHQALLVAEALRALPARRSARPRQKTA